MIKGVKMRDTVIKLIENSVEMAGREIKLDLCDANLNITSYLYMLNDEPQVFIRIAKRVYHSKVLFKLDAPQYAWDENKHEFKEKFIKLFDEVEVNKA